MIRESHNFTAVIQTKFGLSTDTHHYFCARFITHLFAEHLIFLDAEQELANICGAMQGDANPRLSEIAEILAVGLMRLTARKSSQKSAESGEILLDTSARQSGAVAELDGDSP
jgi:hypothetical protein